MENGSFGIMSLQAAEDVGWCMLLICWFCIKDEAQQHFHCCKSGFGAWVMAWLNRSLLEIIHKSIPGLWVTEIRCELNAKRSTFSAKATFFAYLLVFKHMNNVVGEGASLFGFSEVCVLRQDLILLACM